MCFLFSPECEQTNARGGESQDAEANRRSYKEAGHALLFVTLLLRLFFTDYFQNVTISSSSKNAAQSWRHKETTSRTTADLPMVHFSSEMGNDAWKFVGHASSNRHESISATIHSQFSIIYRWVDRNASKVSFFLHRSESECLSGINVGLTLALNLLCLFCLDRTSARPSVVSTNGSLLFIDLHSRRQSLMSISQENLAQEKNNLPLLISYAQVHRPPSSVSDKPRKLTMTSLSPSPSNKATPVTKRKVSFASSASMASESGLSLFSGDKENHFPVNQADELEQSTPLHTNVGKIDRLYLNRSPNHVLPRSALI